MVTPNLSAITDWLISLEHVLPLPIFVIIGSILEELISPIPATLILGVAGSFIALNNLSFYYLIVLTILATFGKTLAAWATYWLGRLLGEFVIVRWGKIVGLNIADVKSVNVKLKAKNTWGLIFAMRALPIAPSAAVSIAAGILHTKQRVFVSSTFFGYIIRNVLTALTGYAGIDIFANWKKYSDNPTYGIIAAIILTLLAIYFFIQAYKKYYSTSK